MTITWEYAAAAFVGASIAGPLFAMLILRLVKVERNYPPPRIEHCIHPLAWARFDGVWHSAAGPLAKVTCRRCGRNRAVPFAPDTFGLVRDLGYYPRQHGVDSLHGAKVSVAPAHVPSDPTVNRKDGGSASVRA